MGCYRINSKQKYNKKESRNEYT